MSDFKQELYNFFRDNRKAAENAFYDDLFDGDYDNLPWDESISVEHHGGEDQGSDYYTVYKFTKGNEELYIKFYGYYSSYDGADYEDFTFVTPKQKTITVYN